MKLDKKVNGGEIEFVLAGKIGKMIRVRNVFPDWIAEAPATLA